MDTFKRENYHSYQLGKLVRELQGQAQKTNNQKKKQVQNQRRMHHSCNEIKKSYRYRKSRPFNNKTKQGQFFEKSPPQVPYLFIPKYKNETFIMPDKVFEKGDAGKRLFIKMKDTSIYSFKDPENQRMTKFLHRQQKNKVISGRKMEELNRILNQADGRQKAKKATEHLKTRKIFNPTRMTSDQFSMVEPMMQPKQEDTFQKKKVTLNKTFGPNLWRPASRGDKLYETSSSFAYKTQGLKRAASHRA